MDRKWEVSILKVFLNEIDNSESWKYERVYYGDSLFKAIITMVQSKRKSSCIKLEWRNPFIT